MSESIQAELRRKGEMPEAFDKPVLARAMLRAAVEIDRLLELGNAYKEYAILLEGAESRLLSLAHVHGYRTPPEAIERGKQIRARIETLKQPTMSSNVDKPE